MTDQVDQLDMGAGHAPAPAVNPQPDGEITFIVLGTAAAAGSKRAFVVNGRARVTDANPQARSWKNDVAAAARDAYHGPLLDGPLEALFRFYRARPKGHLGAHGVKPSAPRWPTTKPDALKLARGVEDALTGVIYRDDSQIVTERIEKHYGEPARVEITIREAS